MKPIEGTAVVTAAEMRAAEGEATASGTSLSALMDRAGRGVAEAVRRLAGASDILVLCGPGNNGGDGYVAAAALRASGVSVRVAAAGASRGEDARAARQAWGAAVETLADAAPATVLVDALFGTGTSRPLDAVAARDLHRLAAAARLRIAVDLPSGVDSDRGEVLSVPPCFDVTLALGAVKLSHLLQPAARYAGAVRVIDIGVEIAADAAVLAPPDLTQPGPDAHKYSRGMVAVVAGAMAGAGELAAVAAMRSGAGYVMLLADGAGEPHALVRRGWTPDALDDGRIGGVVIGPGLGREDVGRERLAAALASERPLVIDGDALHLLDLARLDGRRAILTPHAGEFRAVFGELPGSKIDQARAAARRAGATVVFKGADTVIAGPDGRVAVAEDANDWLSTAGTGDVLAGACGAMLAGGLEPFAAAKAAVWLHGEAARRCGAAFVADDLAAALTPARALL